MSSWARSWAYEQRVGETVAGKWRKNPGAKAVLAAICEFPDQDGRCYVGQETLAQMTDMGVRTVRRQLDFLEKNGWIERGERRRSDGTRTSDYIWALAPPERLRPPATSSAGPAAPQPANLAASDESTGQIVQINRPNCADQPAKLAGPYIEDPSVDPSVDPSGEAAARPGAREEPDREPLPDETAAACLLVLKKVKGMGKDPGKLAPLISELRESFPKADPLRACRDYEYKHRHGMKTTNHANRLRHFFETSHERGEGLRGEAAPGSLANRTGLGDGGNGEAPKEAGNSFRRGYEEEYAWFFGEEEGEATS